MRTFIFRKKTYFYAQIILHCIFIGNNGMKIEFCGAAQTVTGSQHLLSVGDKRVLLDCGLFQGRREEANRINREFIFDPASVDSVILSHAHIDHSGNLPSLVKRGFKGMIFATPPTRDLCAIMLADSASIQFKDATHLAKHKGQNIEPLYTAEDVAETMSRFVTIPYHYEFEPVEGVNATFYDAGHLLGSAITSVHATHRGKTSRICFTGDVGRYNRPVLADPECPPDEFDVILTESTYGGRSHETEHDLEGKLLEIINHTIERHGKLIIPAFSVGRTQEIVYYLNNLANKERLPNIPIYVDSPLAISATHVFRLHPECYDSETRLLMLSDPIPFDFKGLHYVREVAESKRINAMKRPCVIIAGSGMCESGRVLHHLMHNVGKRNTTVLFLGFNAEHTLGRRLADGMKKVRIMGDEYIVRAHIEKLSGLSAHADHGELLAFLDKFKRTADQRIFLVHGELSAQEAFKSALKDTGRPFVENPAKGTVVEL